MRLRAIVLGVAVATLACAGTQGVVYRDATTPDGLNQVASYGVVGAFAKRDARLDGYHSVLFEQGALGYKGAPRIARGYSVPTQGPAQTVELTPEDEARLWRHFRDVFEREFRVRSDLALVSAPGPGTLRVRAHILDLVYKRRGRSPTLESRFNRHAPVFTLVLDVRDSLTDEPLARIVDRRSARAGHGVSLQTGDGLNPAGVRHQMRRWARVLRRHLSQLGA